MQKQSMVRTPLGVFVLFSIVGLMAAIVIEQKAFAENMTAEIDYTIKIGKQKHLVHFTVCAGSENITEADIIIGSTQETKELSLYKVLPANTCKNYEVQLNAKHANRIEVSVI